MSLTVFPHLFIVRQGPQIANPALCPIAAGGVITAVGGWRVRRDQELVRIDRFGCGALFALPLAFVRLVGARHLGTAETAP